MKASLIIIIPALAFGLLLPTSLCTAQSDKANEWDLLFQDNESPPQEQAPAPKTQAPSPDRDEYDLSPAPPQDSDRMHRVPRGQRRGMGPGSGGLGSGHKGHGHRFGPGYGGGDKNQDQGRGRPGRFGPGRKDQITPEMLENFIKEHEPKLAEKLKKLRSENLRKFRRQISALRRLFGGVIVQMKNDPEMGKLSLQKINLNLKIKQKVHQVKNADTDQNKQELYKQLSQNVGNIFDVILTQEKLRLQRWAKHAQEIGFGPEGRKQRKKIRQEQPDPQPDMEGQHPTRRHRGRRGRIPRREDFLKRIEKREKAIESWQQNKEKLVRLRIQELLEGTQPFPWGR